MSPELQKCDWSTTWALSDGQYISVMWGRGRKKTEMVVGLIRGANELDWKTAYHPVSVGHRGRAVHSIACHSDLTGFPVLEHSGLGRDSIIYTPARHRNAFPFPHPTFFETISLLLLWLWSSLRVPRALRRPRALWRGGRAIRGFGCLGGLV